MSFIFEFDTATLLAVAVLVLYSIASLSIFIYRFSNLNAFINTERFALTKLLKGQGLEFDSYFKIAGGNKSKLIFLRDQAQIKLAEGLTWLSIIASTSPFIGLFGTVISIFLTLSALNNGIGDISLIAVPIGHALIATAAGIISAVLAYTFHLIIRRKSMESINLLHSQLEILLDEQS